MADTPLADAVARFLADPGLAFTIPGHKRAPGLGDPLLALDLPLDGGADDLQRSGGYLKAAEALAAELWGADHARFSVNGSSHGNHALLWGIARPGDRVAVSRNLHKSLLVAMILGGVEPVWVFPEVDPATGLALGYPQSAVEDALAQDVAALFLVNPTYVGVMTPLAPIVSAAHRRGVPVAVDQAWGGHLGLDPRLRRTRSARAPTRWCCRCTRRSRALPRARWCWPAGGGSTWRRSMRLRAGSHDQPVGGDPREHRPCPGADRGTRRRADRAGAGACDRAREQLAAVPGVTVFGGGAGYLAMTHSSSWSRSAGAGANGFAVDADLLRAGVRLEMADRDTLVPS